MIKNLEKRIKKEANKDKAKILQRFFKTKPGEYGEGDIFLGIKVPIIRKIAKDFTDISLTEAEKLLDSEIHEKRLIALLILIEKYRESEKKNNESLKKEIFEFYLKNANKSRINNWDLVDLSAPNIVGNYLLDKEPTVLYELARSNNLWERRIAIVSTFAFIRNNEYNHTLKISEILISDSHDLIHKAVGWMLREVGKRNQKILEDFLYKYYKTMPRTMLRYAIERFPEEKRKKYLKGEVYSFIFLQNL